MQFPPLSPPCFLPGMQTQWSPAAILDHEVTLKIDSSAEDKAEKEKEPGTLMTRWSQHTNPGLPSSRCGRVNDTAETVHLRLGLEPTFRDSNLAKTYSLPTEITHLVSGLNEAQVQVSLQKEFSERQSGR